MSADPTTTPIPPACPECQRRAAECNLLATHAIEQEKRAERAEQRCAALEKRLDAADDMLDRMMTLAQEAIDAGNLSAQRRAELEQQVHQLRNSIRKPDPEVTASAERIHAWRTQEPQVTWAQIIALEKEITGEDYSESTLRQRLDRFLGRQPHS